MHTIHELSVDELSKLFGGVSAAAPQTKQGQVFEIEDYSFDIEQVLDIGGQSGG